MWSVVKSVDIDEGLCRAYMTWACLEGLPSPVTDPRGVECIRYTRLRWPSDEGDDEGARDTHIAVEPCTGGIVWRSVTGILTTTVLFECVSDDTTRITMKFSSDDDSRSPGERRTALAAAEAELRASLDGVARQPSAFSLEDSRPRGFPVRPTLEGNSRGA